MNAISIFRSNIVRGLAILAVLLLHILPYLKGVYHGDQQVFYVFIDQVARFCVPAFLMLSGYGLMVKYQHKDIQYVSFTLGRIAKLLPVYLLWSFASMAFVSSVPEWSVARLLTALLNEPMAVLIKLLLGRADYQLYFLSVLFQLYLLFPLLLGLIKRYPKVTLFLAFLIQLSMYIYFASNPSNSDRFQYVLSLSWIGYFVLGMYLRVSTIPKMLLKVAPALTLLSITVVTAVVVSRINAGLNPLPALKFTKLIIVLYILFVCLSLFYVPRNALKRIPSAVRTFLETTLTWLGKNSYIIFLSHTIAFRIINVFLQSRSEPFALLKTTIIWLVLVFISHKMLTTKIRFPNTSK